MGFLPFRCLFRETAPSLYLLCAGQAVSRIGATAALFAAIGTTYGSGDGSTTKLEQQRRSEYDRHRRGRVVERAANDDPQLHHKDERLIAVARTSRGFETSAGWIAATITLDLVGLVSIAASILASRVDEARTGTDWD